MGITGNIVCVIAAVAAVAGSSNRIRKNVEVAAADAFVVAATAGRPDRFDPAPRAVAAARGRTDDAGGRRVHGVWYLCVYVRGKWPRT